MTKLADDEDWFALKLGELFFFMQQSYSSNFSRNYLQYFKESEIGILKVNPLAFSSHGLEVTKTWNTCQQFLREWMDDVFEFINLTLMSETFKVSFI